MNLVRQSALLVLALGACLAARAADEKLVEGRYSFRLDGGAGPVSVNHNELARSLSAMGTFVVEGKAITQGRRTVFRPVYRAEPGGDEAPGYELVIETFKGSYSMEPDGSGVMTLQLGPRKQWTPQDPPGTRLYTPLDTEEVHFVAMDEGRHLELVSLAPVRFQWAELGEPKTLSFRMDGFARHQTASCPGPPSPARQSAP